MIDGNKNIQPDVDNCRASCHAIQAPYFSYHPETTKACMCKSTDAGRRTLNGAVSGATACAGCQLGGENDVDYYGNDDFLQDGKMKCSSTLKANCINASSVPDAQSCTSFCLTSEYYTWKAHEGECYCKNSASGRRRSTGSTSGRTNCQTTAPAYPSQLFSPALTVSLSGEDMNSVENIAIGAICTVCQNLVQQLQDYILRKSPTEDAAKQFARQLCYKKPFDFIPAYVCPHIMDQIIDFIWGKVGDRGGPCKVCSAITIPWLPWLAMCQPGECTIR